MSGYVASSAPNGTLVEAVKQQSDFDGFLKALNVECQKKLEVLPKPGDGFPKDPLLAAMADEKERSLLRETKARSRVAAMEDKIRRSTVYEADWREQVRQRKEAERRRSAAEAIAATVALEIALEAAAEADRVQEDSKPLAVARRNWAANDLAASEAREKAVRDEEAGVRLWLDGEWQPRLESHRQLLRTQRAAEEQRVQEARLNRQRESDALAHEDAASKSFVFLAASECERRSAQMRMGMDSSARAVIDTVLAAKEAERRQAMEQERQRQQAEETSQRLEAKKKDYEYKEWRREVRNARCTRKRVEDCDTPSSEKDVGSMQPEVRKDFLKEKDMMLEAVLDDALQRAVAETRRLKENGLSPRSVLEEARKRATLDKKQQEKSDSTNVEHELWESLLAKNRLARQQERSMRTPRWGIFTT